MHAKYVGRGGSGESGDLSAKVLSTNNIYPAVQSNQSANVFGQQSNTQQYHGVLIPNDIMVTLYHLRYIMIKEQTVYKPQHTM